MCLKLVLLPAFVLFKITFLFVVAATMISCPPQLQNSNNDEATKLRLLQTTLNEINHRLEIFETQIDQIRGTQDINSYQLKLLELKINQQSLQTILNRDKINELQTDIKENNNLLKITNPPRSCKEVLERGHNVSDIYFIQPKTAYRPFMVLCDMETRGGGWTYILNRYDESQDFYLNWNNYTEGFGSLAKEFWLGLDNIHYLTGYETNELLIELTSWDNEERYARYNSFVIGNEAEGYALKLIEGYTGDAGDRFSDQNGMKFSTFDNDQSVWGIRNRASYEVLEGGWWYSSILNGQLTGKYIWEKNSENNYKGILWFYGNQDSYKQARMMIRPRDHSKPVSLPHKT